VLTAHSRQPATVMRNPMRQLLTIFILAVAGLSIGQTFKYPKIVKDSDSISGFIPLGWIIRDSVSGIMDRKKVHVLVLQHRDTVALNKKVDDKICAVKTFPRVLLVAIKDSLIGRFHLLIQNNRFIPTMNDVQFDVPEPFDKVSIEKDILKFKLLDNFAPRVWYTYHYKFRFRKNHFTLIGADIYYNNGVTGDTEETSFNFLTKKGIDVVKPYDIERNRSEKTQTSSFDIKVNELRTLENMHEYKTWEVAPDRLL
jgi:hypothetical protein